MKARTFGLLLSFALVSGRAVIAAAPADLTQVVASAATYESGASMESLRQIEILVRQSVGDSRLQKTLEAELAKLITGNSTYEAKHFACQQLSIIGTDRSLHALETLIKDEATVGIACLALGTRPSSKANAILRNALLSLRGAARVQVIGLLGERRDRDAVKSLAGLARDADRATAEAAIVALGKIADRSARETIAALRKEAKPELARAVLDASLRIAQQLAVDGDRKAAAAVYQELDQPSQPAYVRRAAKTALESEPQRQKNRLLSIQK
jgi:HEAT repeat protein